MINLSNPHHKLVIESDGQKFEVRALCHRKDTANILCSLDPTIAVIDTDWTSETIILADIEPMKNNLTNS